MTYNFSIRTRTSALPPIVSHTGSRKVRFTSLPFDSPTLCLGIYVRNGNQIVKPGCVCIHNHWSTQWNANITIVSQVQSNSWLDGGHGSCVLRRHDCAAIVAEALRHFDGERCAQIAWVVMPNHVHAVFVLNPAWPLEKIILSWKGFTARRINPLIGRTGNFWQRDYFDRLVRDVRHLANCLRYIRRNPSKAGLHAGEFVLYESELAKGIE